MNKYELILILNPDLSSKFGPYQEHLEGVLNQLSFEIKYCENIGTRSLAYSILNHNKAHYLIYQLEGEGSKINELESKIKYDSSVLRHLLLKVDSHSLTDSFLSEDTKQAQKRDEERAHEAKLREDTKILQSNGDSSADDNSETNDLEDNKKDLDSDKKESSNDEQITPKTDENELKDGEEEKNTDSVQD